jgi:hypothetical protein
MVYSLLMIYGVFLIGCGIVSVALIGMKAKTALASGGTSGVIALTLGWLIMNQNNTAQVFAIAFTGILFVVFSWRSAKTLFKIFELVPLAHADLQGKGIAFLIISLMAVVSIFATILQIMYYLN